MAIDRSHVRGGPPLVSAPPSPVWLAASVPSRTCAKAGMAEWAVVAREVAEPMCGRGGLAALFCANECSLLALSDQKCLLCPLSFVSVGTELSLLPPLGSSDDHSQKRYNCSQQVALPQTHPVFLYPPSPDELFPRPLPPSFAASSLRGFRRVLSRCRAPGPLRRADRRRHEHLPADWGPVPPGGHRHPTAEDLEDALLCGHFWEKPASVCTGLHNSLPGSFYFVHFTI